MNRNTSTARAAARFTAAAFVLAAAAATASGQASGLPPAYTVIRVSPSLIASVTVGDFNGDGLSDIAWTESGATQVQVVLATGGGRFAAPVPTEIGERGCKVLAANFIRTDTGAQRSELAVIRPGFGDCLMFAPRGDGRFDVTGSVSLGGNYKNACLGDMDGSGTPEIIVSRTNYSNPGNPANPTDSGAWNNGGRGIRTIVVRPDGTLTGVDQLSTLTTAQGVAIGDINKDGRADLVTMWRYPGTNVADWYNKYKFLVHFGGRNANGTPASGFGSMAQRWTNLKGYLADGVAVCDIDQDRARNDLVFMSRENRTIEVALNNGQNDPESWIRWSFVRPNHITSANMISASLVRTADEQPVWMEDENGRMVAMTMVKTNNTVAAQKLWNIEIPSGYHATIAAGDFDGDRDTDLVITAAQYLLVSGNPAQNTRPVVGGLTLSGEAKIGRAVTLTAQNVSDPDLTDKVAKVSFYLDLDNSGSVTAPDALLGTDSDGGNGWRITSTLASTFPTSARFLAVATDDLGLEGNAAALSQNLAPNGRPVVTGLRFDKDQATTGQAITLSADGVADSDADGSIREVRFYRDANRNGAFDMSDEMLGSDSNPEDGWTISTTAQSTWGAGVIRFFAVATDDAGDTSPARENSIVAVPASTPDTITIGSFSSSHATRQWTTRLALSATGVSRGTVAVYFFADTDRDGFLTDADRMIARGSPDGLGNWTARVRITRAFGTGPIKIFALASDATGENGDVKELLLRVRTRNAR